MFIKSNVITAALGLACIVLLKTVNGFSTSLSSAAPPSAARTTLFRRNVHSHIGERRKVENYISLLMKNSNNDNDIDMTQQQQQQQEQDQKRRRAFLQQSLLLLPYHLSSPANAFDGGVGGLGKTKPEMGILFVNPDDTSSPSSGNGEIVTNELVSPDAGNIPVLVSFEAPWPTLKSSTNIESRDLANPEAAFVQVASKKGRGGGGDVVLKKDFFEETIFGSQGKFGAYGSPTDIKIRRLPPPSSSTSSSPPPPPPSSTTITHDIYIATFTTLTPAMRESERKAYISTYTINDKDVFMLVVGTTANRFEKRDALLKRVAESFVVVEAPKSSLSSLNRR